MKLILSCFLIAFTFMLNAQTWSDNVAQLVYNKCTKCHNPQGIAPFSLMTYGEVAPMASAVQAAIESNNMPPWPPDNNYQTYSHDRSLTNTEKTTILDWIANGTPEGNSANTPPPPVYNTNLILGPGDLTVQIPTYMSKATALNDDYVCFSLPSGLLQNRVIKSVEIVPGNREIVHHALIYIDADAAEVTDSVGGNCAGPSFQNTKLITGYTPGAVPMTLPSVSPLKLGIDLPAGSNIYLGMHYPSGSYGQFDSTKVIFHFYPIGTTGVRQVEAAPIISNWAFSLPNNQETTVTGQYPASGGLPVNISVLSVFPHMHLLGQTIKAFAIDPALDTIKFINIPQWDFHWQDFYFFKNIQKAPTGSVIKGEGLYFNNTGSTVNAGTNTTDEMFLVYFHYMLYQNGDENYDMEALMNASIDEQQLSEGSIKTYPNPFSEGIHIENSSVKSGDVVTIYIYDQQGKLVGQPVEKITAMHDGFEYVWEGKSDDGSSIRNGIYFVSMMVNGTHSYSRVIKQ